MKAVIVEDEKLNVAELTHLLGEVAPGIEVIQVCPSLRTTRRWLQENKEPDVFFMDIRLGDGLVFELFDQYCFQSKIVFTTAYDEYAIKAFKVNGVDYLLKPIQKEDLQRAVSRLQQNVVGVSALSPEIQQLVNYFAKPGEHPSSYKERFIINAHGKLLPVETKDIALFMKDTLIYIYLLSGEKLIYDYSTLEQIEALLDPQQFFRVNRQSIVNINAIHSAKPQPNLKLDLFLKPPLKLTPEISRDKASLFRKWLDR